MQDQSRNLGTCPCCAARLSVSRHDWLKTCTKCNFLCSTLQPAINDVADALDEGLREEALSPLRRENFDSVLDALDAEGLDAGQMVLDVGCAHGWFLENAKSRGLKPVGVEPDKQMAEIAKSRGIEVREGFFPNALVPSEKFDAVVFNDVLEHIPDITSVMGAVHDVLRPGGVVAINIPLSTGVFYRTASTLDKIGISGPFLRMWQKGFPSPHLSYVNQSNLAQIAKNAGLEEVSRQSLRSISGNGLWQRLRYDTAMPFVAACVVFAGVSVLRPMLPLLPADIGLQVFRKKP